MAEPGNPSSLEERYGGLISLSSDEEELEPDVKEVKEEKPVSLEARYGGQISDPNSLESRYGGLIATDDVVTAPIDEAPAFAGKPTWWDDDDESESRAYLSNLAQEHGVKTEGRLEDQTEQIQVIREIYESMVPEGGQDAWVRYGALAKDAGMQAAWGQLSEQERSIIEQHQKASSFVARVLPNEQNRQSGPTSNLHSLVDLGQQIAGDSALTESWNQTLSERQKQDEEFIKRRTDHGGFAGGEYWNPLSSTGLEELPSDPKKIPGVVVSEYERQFQNNLLRSIQPNVMVRGQSQINSPRGIDVPEMREVLRPFFDELTALLNDNESLSTEEIEKKYGSSAAYYAQLKKMGAQEESIELAGLTRPMKNVEFEKRRQERIEEIVSSWEEERKTRAQAIESVQKRGGPGASDALRRIYNKPQTDLYAQYRALAPADQLTNLSIIAMLRELAERNKPLTPENRAIIAKTYGSVSGGNLHAITGLIMKHIPPREMIHLAGMQPGASWAARNNILEIDHVPQEMLAAMEDHPQILKDFNQYKAARKRSAPGDSLPSNIDLFNTWVEEYPPEDAGYNPAEHIEALKRDLSETESLTRINRQSYNVAGIRRSGDSYVDLAESIASQNLEDSETFRAIGEGQTQYDQRMKENKTLARRFLRETGQTASQSAVEAIAWGLQNNRVPLGLHTWAETAGIQQAGVQPLAGYRTDPAAWGGAPPDLEKDSAETEALMVESYEYMENQLPKVFSAMNDREGGTPPFAFGATAEEEKTWPIAGLPFPIRHEYTRQSINNLSGVEAAFIEQAYKWIESQGAKPHPRMVYAVAHKLWRDDPGQQNFKELVAIQQGQEAEARNEARRRRNQDLIGDVEIPTMRKTGEMQVNSPQFYNNILVSVQARSKRKEGETAAQQDARDRQEARSVFGSMYAGMQGVTFYRPMSSESLADQYDWAPDFARLGLSRLVPVLSGGDFNPSYGTGGRELRYKDLKTQGFLWQVFDAAPVSSYLSSFAKYGVGPTLSGERHVIEGMVGENIITAAPFIHEDFSRFFGSFLPDVIANPMADLLTGTTVFMTFFEPDIVVGGLWAVKGLTGGLNLATYAQNKGAKVADAYKIFNRAYDSTSPVEQQLKLLGNLQQNLGKVGPSYDAQFTLGFQANLGNAWGQGYGRLTKALDGKLPLEGADALNAVLEAGRSRVKLRKEIEALKQQAKSASPEEATRLLREADEAEALAARADYIHWKAEQAKIDAEHAFRMSIGSDLSDRVIRDGITLGDPPKLYKGEAGFRELVNDATERLAKIRGEEAALIATMGHILPGAAKQTPYTALKSPTQGPYKAGFEVKGARVIAKESPPARVGSLDDVKNRWLDAQRKQTALSQAEAELGGLYKAARESATEAEETLAKRVSILLGDDEFRSADVYQQIKTARRAYDDKLQEIKAAGGSAEQRKRWMKGALGDYIRDQQRIVGKLLEGADIVNPRVFRKINDSLSSIGRSVKEASDILEKGLPNIERLAYRVREAEKARAADNAWIQSLNAKKQRLGLEKRALAELQPLIVRKERMIQAQAKIDESFDAWTRLSKQKVDDDALNAIDDVLDKMSQELEVWGRNEWIPIALEEASKVAKRLEASIRKNIEFLKAKGAEVTASAAVRFADSIDEIVNEVDDLVLRDYALDIYSQLQRALPPGEGDVVWNVMIKGVADQWAINAGRFTDDGTPKWWEWVEANVKGVRVVERPAKAAADEAMEGFDGIIRVFKDGDISDIMKQITPMIRKTLSYEQQAVARQWIAGEIRARILRESRRLEALAAKASGNEQLRLLDEVKRNNARLEGVEASILDANKQWSQEAKDIFSYAVIRMLRGGESGALKAMPAGSPVRKLFSQSRAMLTDVYKTIKQHEEVLGSLVKPRMRDTLERVLGVQYRTNIDEIIDGRRFNGQKFKEKIKGLLNEAEISIDASDDFIESWIRNIGGPEADILRRLWATQDDVILGSQDLQRFHTLLDDLPDTLLHFQLVADDMLEGAITMRMADSKYYMALRDGLKPRLANQIRRYRQIFDPEGVKLGEMSPGLQKVMKANSARWRQIQDELVLVIQGAKTDSQRMRQLLAYIDNTEDFKMPNGFTIMNSQSKTIYENLQDYIRLAARQEGSDDIAEPILEAISRIFVQNTAKTPISKDMVFDLQNAARWLLTGEKNSSITLNSLGKPVVLKLDGKPIAAGRPRIDFIDAYPGGPGNIAFNPASSMAEFIEQFKKAHLLITRQTLKGVRADIASPVNAVQLAAQIAGGAKVQTDTLYDLRRVFGVFTEKEAQAVNDVLESPDIAINLWERVNEHMIRSTRIPYMQATRMGQAQKGAAKISRKLIQMSKTLDGDAVFIPEDLFRAFKSNMDRLIKDIDKISAESIASTDFALMSMWRGYMSLWRQSVLTGLIFPNPRYWTNNIFGDFSQMMIVLGPKKAAQLSFQNLFANVEFRGLKPHTALLKASEKAQGKPVLGSVLNALFNPRLNGLWSGKKGVLKLPNGRQVPYSKFRRWLVEDDILDTFTQAELGQVIKDQQRAKLMSLKGIYQALDKSKVQSKLFGSDFSRMAHATMVQQRQRGALYLSLLEEGYSRAQARKITLDALYDWSNAIGQHEASFLNSVMPFWRFQKLAINQMIKTTTEAWTMPGKEYGKLMLKGQTRWQRTKAQVHMVRHTPDYFADRSSPEYRQGDDLSEAEKMQRNVEEMNALAEVLTPPWAIRVVQYLQPQRLNQAQLGYMKSDLGFKYAPSGYRVWYGPELTAVHEMNIFASVFTLLGGVTSKLSGYGTRGRDWEAQVFEPWLGMAHEPWQRLLGYGVKLFGMSPGYMPGQYKTGRFSRIGQGELRLLKAFGLGDHTYEDSKGKQYADDFLVFLVSSIPFVGLQLAGVVDKAGKAVGFTKADDSWSALNGIGYFLAGWTGIAKPYEFSPELNFEQYMRARKLMVDEFTQKERKERAAFEAKAKGL